MQDLHSRPLPQHIAIIMDGNGRWAEKHTLGRLSGHRRGAETVRTIVRICREIGIRYLTLYAFSVENWSRPSKEVSALMHLLGEYIHSELSDMLQNGIRLTMIGNIEALDASVRQLLERAMAETAGNKEMTLNLALSYGGRDEIVRAVSRIVQDVREGGLSPQEVTTEVFSRYLYTADIPDPDLLIRTSGEYRLSNFLLWQSAYTEFYFTDILWPDFGREELLAAIKDYQKRERRYGLTSEQVRKDS